MNKKQNEIIEFLSKFKSCNLEQLIFFTNCTKHDINYLLTEKLILKDKDTRLLYLKMRKRPDVRTAVALDVVKSIKDEVLSIQYSNKYPIIFNVVTHDRVYCDIAVVRSLEQDSFFKKLRDYPVADKIIIVLESEQYNKRLINTNKEVLICTYPIKIIDKFN